MTVTRRHLIGIALLAAPVALLPACVAGGPGGGTPEALRRLLEICSQRAVTRLVRDGGYLADAAARVPVPAELGGGGGRGAAIASALLRSRPVQQRLLALVNDAAGAAADRAAPLVYDSIRQLTFADALGIVRGGPTAATDYLERSVGDRILDAMVPGAGEVLGSFGDDGVLGPVLGAATGVDVTGLQRVVARAAARGLWGAIGREEAAIRANPASAGDGLVEAVLTGARLAG